MSTCVPTITITPGVPLHTPIPFPLTSKANTMLNFMCHSLAFLKISHMFESVNNILLSSVCF